MTFFTEIPNCLLDAVEAECQLAESEGREPQTKNYFYQLLSSRADTLQEDDWVLMIFYFSSFVERNTAKYFSACSGGNLVLNHCVNPEREISLPFAMESMT